MASLRAGYGRPAITGPTSRPSGPQKQGTGGTLSVIWGRNGTGATRQRSLPARVVERARIVLLAAEGLENKQIAQRLGIWPEKAARWRSRFLAGGIASLEKDAPRPGRTRTIGDRRMKKVVEMTLHRNRMTSRDQCNQESAILSFLAIPRLRRTNHSTGKSSGRRLKIGLFSYFNKM